MEDLNREGREEGIYGYFSANYARQSQLLGFVEDRASGRKAVPEA